MSWVVEHAPPERKYGPSWVTVHTGVPPVHKGGWFVTSVERVAQLSGGGTLSAVVKPRYPQAPAALGGSGSLSAAITVRYNIGVVTFSGQGLPTGKVFQTVAVIANFSAAGVLDMGVNDGLIAIITPGYAASLSGVGALTATITGGLNDGLSATVEPVVATTVDALLSGSGALTATIRPFVDGLYAEIVAVVKTFAEAPFTGTGTLSATVEPVTAAERNADLSGDGALTGIVIGYRMAEGMLTATLAKGITTSLAGSGALSATAVGAVASPVAAALSGSGALSAAAVRQHPMDAALAGSGALSATVTPVAAANPVYNSVGVGHGRNSTTIFWTHDIPVGTDILVVFSSGGAGATGANQTAVCGATPMTQHAKVADFANFISEYGFVLLNPPSGTQTITVTSTVSHALAGNSVAYDNVGSVGTAITKRNTANATALSLAAASSVGQVVAQAFATGASTGLTAYNQTQRWLKNYQSGANYALIIGEAPGDPALNFAVTSGTSLPYGAIAIPLVGV